MSGVSIFIWVIFFSLLLVIVVTASKDVVVWAMNLVCAKVYESKFKAKGVDFSLDLSTKRLFNLPPYIRSPHAQLFRLLHRLNLESGLNFVDCGSGKGNVLYEVSSFDFKLLGGIEINSKLHDICQKNLELLLPDRQYSLINKSVLACDTEFDQFDVFYCYGLFKLDQLYEFVTKLLDSKQRRVRSIWVIYTNLVSQKPFLENKFKEIYFFSRSSIYDFQTVVFKHDL